MRKNLLTMLFSIGLLFMILPIVARAEDNGWCGQDVKWTFNEGVLTISGEGDMSITGSIPWREYCDSIETIKIESGVTSIEGAAFSGCSNLISVTLPEGMTTIGKCAFSRCSSFVFCQEFFLKKIVKIPHFHLGNSSD